MKNWKILAVFGLIAVLFVFAGCFAGTTPEEPTATPEPTVAPTSTPTPLPAFNGTIDTVSFLGTGDTYLNIDDSKSNATVSGTVSGTDIRKVEVYFVKLKALDGCNSCGVACDQPWDGDPIFMGEEIFTTAQTGVNISWSVTISADKLAALETGAYYKVLVKAYYGVCGSCALEETDYYEGNCFEVDLEAPKLTCQCCGFEGVVDTKYEVTSVSVTGTVCDCADGNNTTDLKVVASASVSTGQYVDSSDEVVWYVQRVSATQVKFFNGTDEVLVDALPGETKDVTLDGVEVSVTFTSNINTCCPDKLTITPDTDGDTFGKITLGFSEDVKLGSADASVTINNGVGSVIDPETWSLKGDEASNQTAGLYADSWTFYNCGSATDASIGAIFRISPPTFEDEAGNTGSSDAFCNGVFMSGDVDCP